MFWVVQQNLINPQTLAHLLACLRAAGTAYALADLIPFANELAGPVVVPKTQVFTYGSTGMGAVAKSQGWAPGYFDHNLDYRLFLAAYGGLALNARAAVAPMAELQALAGPFFVRPILDDKSFPGSVMTWAAFEDFRAGVARVASDPGATLRLTDVVIAAPVVELQAEARFFVIDGRVVTGSYYVQHRQARTGAVAPEVWAFAQHCADVWSPNAAYALDVAITNDGLRVLEVNSANSAGFYACDVAAIVAAVNQLS